VPPQTRMRPARSAAIVALACNLLLGPSLLGAQTPTTVRADAQLAQELAVACQSAQNKATLLANLVKDPDGRSTVLGADPIAVDDLADEIERTRRNSARVAIKHACSDGQPHITLVTFARSGVHGIPAIFAATKPLFQIVEPLSPGGNGKPSLPITLDATSGR
jgi:hypothetical protein